MGARLTSKRLVMGSSPISDYSRLNCGKLRAFINCFIIGLKKRCIYRRFTGAREHEQFILPVNCEGFPNYKGRRLCLRPLS